MRVCYTWLQQKFSSKNSFPNEGFTEFCQTTPASHITFRTLERIYRKFVKLSCNFKEYFLSLTNCVQKSEHIPHKISSCNGAQFNENLLGRSPEEIVVYTGLYAIITQCSLAIQ
jgi:hypothetical protein